MEIFEHQDMDGNGLEGFNINCQCGCGNKIRIMCEEEHIEMNIFGKENHGSFLINDEDFIKLTNKINKLRKDKKKLKGVQER